MLHVDAGIIRFNRARLHEKRGATLFGATQTLGRACHCRTYTRPLALRLRCPAILRRANGAEQPRLSTCTPLACRLLYSVLLYPAIPICYYTPTACCSSPRDVALGPTSRSKFARFHPRLSPLVSPLNDFGVTSYSLVSYRVVRNHGRSSENSQIWLKHKNN